MIKNRLIKGFIFSLFLSAVCIANGQTYVPGNSYFGRNNYIEYTAGNLPIIITVPHGGTLTPSEIPDRTCGENVSDSYTISLVREIRDAINLVTGCYPHIIINHLKRSRLDANREIDEAACGNPYGEIAWNEFHKFIDSAKANVTRKSGKGLYIDLHGHGHSIQRLELGYLLSGTQLSYSDATLNSTTYKNSSSIRNLIYQNVTNQTHAALLHGSFSFGTMTSLKGYPAVPSSDDPFPQPGDSYFNGGYNTLRHGSKTEGTIDAIQIECNQDVRFDETTRKKFASDIATVFLDYLIKHYFPQLPLTYCNIVDVDHVLSSGIKVYPNPFSSILSVQSPFETELQIYNFMGSLVYCKRLAADEKINLGHLDEGIYLMNIVSNGKVVYREKLVKKLK